MRRKEQGRNKVELEERVLDVNATMQGSLRFDDPVNLRISGKFEGTLDTKGKLMVGDRAEIRANITGEEISINGNVTGNIKAAKVLRLGKNAILSGDIETPALSVEHGAILNGQVRMEGSAPVNFAGENMGPSQLAKYLEVDIDKIEEWANGGILPGVKENGDWIFEKNKVDKWVAQGKIKA